MATAQTNGSAVTSTSTKNNGGVAKHIGTSSVLDNVSVTNPPVGVFGSTVLDNDYSDKALSGGVFKHDNLRPISKRVTTTLATVSKPVLQSGALVPANLRMLHKKESYKVNQISKAIRNGYWNIYTGKFSLDGTYSRTGTTVTVSAVKHGLVTGDSIRLDFTSGAATDGIFAVTVVDVNSFTVTHGTSGSTSGNVTLIGPSFNTETPGSNGALGPLDRAANVSRSSPGQLVYRTGAPLPVRDDYKAKTA